ncbi:MAG: hypothetical protein GY715_16065 [Planctomycetes bacterium]|nr:hypothetical protein [Planctomycetota bacterium]
MSTHPLIRGSARAILSLAPAVAHQRYGQAEQNAVRRAVERGHFRPDEEETLRQWFARYLTARAGLLETIGDLRPLAEGQVQGARPSDELRAFVIAYTAACLLVRAGRFLVGNFATHRIIQRKLNEPCLDHRIPRRQYTTIRRSLTSPINVWRLHQAVDFADRNRSEILRLAKHPLLGPVIDRLDEEEEALRIDVTTYVKARLRYRLHSWRRRRSSAAQQGLFRILEAFGRVIADVRTPGHVDRLHAAARDELVGLLEPGDVIVARHDNALSNLFLPGYWPHAALHVGLPHVREMLSIEVDEPQRSRWKELHRVLEARKDGVLFRPIEDTLAVDAVVVLRPQVGPGDVARAIENAVRHEGKLYNFDFDFFNDERLVCTEVVYRAYEGVGGLEFTLADRGGRPTLSAEDLVRMAVERRGFEPVALYGTPKLGKDVVVGPEAAHALTALHRDTFQ